MKETYVNFEQQQQNQEQNFDKKKFSWKKLFTYLIVIIILLVVFFIYDLISSGRDLSESLGQTGIWQQVKHLISSDDKKLAGEEDDRINAIILGMGGIKHEGPFLTDTVILASFKPSTKEASMISIPRDMIAYLPGYGWYKINHANAYAEAAQPGSGGTYTSQVISEVFNLPIHYYITIDFEGFINIVDDLGGITVEVENTFDDFKYPIVGQETATTSERYEHLHFDAGKQHMNGEIALKFARSRFSESIEGSDFARARRQQRVILAVKEKVFSWQTLVNPYKISRTLENIGNHIKTNMEVWEIYNLYKLSKDIQSADIKHVILDASPEGYLEEFITEEGAFILQPKRAEFDLLKNLANNIFTTKITGEEILEPDTSTQEQKETMPEIIAKDEFDIEIQNGTIINGLAGRTSIKLESSGFDVITIGNARSQDYNKTFIYDLTPQIEKDTYLEELEKVFGISTSINLPGWLNTSGAVNPATDILIILGTDYAND